MSREMPAIVLSHDVAKIKENADYLRARLRDIDAERKAVVALMQANNSLCAHDGAKRGYNERDGSWMNPCPTCGHAE